MQNFSQTKSVSSMTVQTAASLSSVTSFLFSENVTEERIELSSA